MFQANRIFEEGFYGNGPEFMVIDRSILTQQVTLSPLHGGKNRAGYFGEILKFFFKVFVLFSFSDKRHISQGMPHFVETDVTIRRQAADALDKIIPGEINTALIHMPHKRPGIKSIMVIVFQNEDIIEIF